ncbi:MAG: hypothetical protein LBU26_03470 [Synergistaceae bacterium]|nr:hypothetical protein [Synergistaceae bacterium]
MGHGRQTNRRTAAFEKSGPRREGGGRKSFSLSGIPRDWRVFTRFVEAIWRWE